MTNKIEQAKKKMPAKRVDIVSIKMVKERSVLYEDRKITSPGQVVKITKEFLEHSDREKFIVIFLNTKNEPNCIEVVSTGSLNASIVHPREVMKSAILSNSNNMLLVHNHPSGTPEPSHEDKNITKRLVKVGDLLGIAVIDHVIVGDGSYFSFKEEGLL